MHSRVFDQMATMVLARDLQRSLGPELDAGMTCDEAADLLTEDEFYIDWESVCIVTKNHMPVGWLAYECLAPDCTVADCMESIDAYRLLSADTSALEIAELFSNPDSPGFFFVLDHRTITGVIGYQDLLSLPFRLCLLAVSLGLESSALDLLRSEPRESWDSLPEARQRKAVEVYTKRYGEPPDPDHLPLVRLLACTMFCDKAKILKKREILSGVSASQIESIFSEAERIRNACAHTDPEEGNRQYLVERERLARFIADISSITAAIEDSLP